MRAQTAAVIAASFLLSHAAGVLFYTLDRQGALEMTEAVDLIERAAGVSRLLRELPEDWQTSLVRSSDSRAFRVWVSAEPVVVMRDPTQAELDIDAYLRTQVPLIPDDGLRVRFLEEPGDRVTPPPFDPAGRFRSLSSRLDGPYAPPSLAIAIRHGEGEWINFLGALGTPRSLVPELFLANVASAVVGIALVAFWLVSRVTSPLGRLGEAAERLGRDIAAEPLAVSGPREVVVAARAFNIMQRRLQRLVRGRTDLLAGISHDLRTPLTQLRLRLELQPDSPDREKNLLALDEMNAIIGTFLSYARASSEVEERSRIDLGALVTTVCDDMSDLGAAIDCTAEPGLIVSCKRLAIKRAVTNLVENAVKYGLEARVSATRQGPMVSIAVEDRGPGIPDAQLGAVLQPFRRGEPPNASGGSGAGLGLSIAQAIAEDHGGEVRLANRASGGLRAEVLLPLP
jgi:signal transduction histidine kinase